ncbi:putative chromosome-partitioning protein ParB [Pseudovibrio axinellae]|uniref:Putative chromosome-partitioning protein ParB n=1 Tax=Pseudovibrio axinellae TaxID=989403 RepID=A0A165U323_9HYPH|nr:plasmid partitioning protein RepB [Pseudovibrio axinellae]KZL10347.1 putative chromosome-partitioning protein ParB [Pseudovibrio axinellae]SER81452.1 chromosome partitioning protein, ParB family [Pseudovibrio axinellae]
MTTKRSEGRKLLNSIISGDMPKSGSVHNTPVVPAATKVSRTSPLGLMSDALSEVGRSKTSISHDQVQSIDPHNCIPSLVEDRLQLDHDEDFEQLKGSIRQDGQQVPVLVRPMLGEPDKYQIAFGHRRWKACLELDVMLKAVVQDLSDEQLVVAQGQENHERKNLSFIETALFAAKLSKDYPSSVVIRAIGAKSKGALSNYLKVPRLIPDDIIKAIGPAPKVGRPSWMKLGEIIDTAPTHAGKLAKLLNPIKVSAKWQNSTSSERFQIVLKAAEHNFAEKKASAKKELSALPSSSGDLAKYKNSAKGASFQWEGDRGREFGEYLVNQLPDLVKKFDELQKDKT